MPARPLHPLRVEPPPIPTLAPRLGIRSDIRQLQLAIQPLDEVVAWDTWPELRSLSPPQLFPNFQVYVVASSASIGGSWDAVVQQAYQNYSATASNQAAWQYFTTSDVWVPQTYPLFMQSCSGLDSFNARVHASLFSAANVTVISPSGYFNGGAAFLRSVISAVLLPVVPGSSLYARYGLSKIRFTIWNNPLQPIYRTRQSYSAPWNAPLNCTDGSYTLSSLVLSYGFVPTALFSPAQSAWLGQVLGGQDVPAASFAVPFGASSVIVDLTAPVTTDLAPAGSAWLYVCLRASNGPRYTTNPFPAGLTSTLLPGEQTVTLQSVGSPLAAGFVTRVDFLSSSGTIGSLFPL